MNWFLYDRDLRHERVKLNMHEAFRRRPRRLLNDLLRSIYVLCPGDLEISITIILYTAYFVLTIVWVQ